MFIVFLRDCNKTKTTTTKKNRQNKVCLCSIWAPHSLCYTSKRFYFWNKKDAHHSLAAIVCVLFCQCFNETKMRGFTGPIEEIILSVSRLNFSELSSRYTRSRSKCVSISLHDNFADFKWNLRLLDNIIFFIHKTKTFSQTI